MAGVTVDLLKAALSQRGLSTEGSQVDLEERLRRALEFDRGAEDVAQFDSQTVKSMRPPGEGRAPQDPRSFKEDPLVLPPTVEEMQERSYVDLLYREVRTFDVAPGVEASAYLSTPRQLLKPWERRGPRDETHAVVMLSDVYGWRDKKMRAMADEFAFTCQAIVVLPDLFDDEPWDDQMGSLGGPEYERWRSRHKPRRVSNIIGACVNDTRDSFDPHSLGLVGFCYGGGRALEEAASGQVQPSCVVAFHPTRYDPVKVAAGLSCPVAAFFGEDDKTPGATVQDGRDLKDGLDAKGADAAYMLRKFDREGHGFVLRPVGDSSKQAAQEALLLGTVWLETYLEKRRVFGDLIRDSNLQG